MVTASGITENPFSSHLVEPSCGGYIFRGDSPGLDAVIQRLRLYRWRGELLGPHGAGKSTLLTDIGARLESQGLKLARWRCSGETRSLPQGWLHQLRQADVVILDGGERLLPGLLCALRALTRFYSKGLIVTAHRRLRIGAVIPVKPDPVAITAKIRKLCRACPGEIIFDIEKAMDRYDGNARELLIDLYLQFEHERQRRATVSP